MSDFDIYVLILCIIVFVALTATFAVAIGFIVRMTVRLIACGAEDDKLKAEYSKLKKQTKWSRIISVADRAFSIVLCCVFCAVFVTALFVNVTGNGRVGDIPRLQVVNSGSMAVKFEKNDYLEKNGLDDQIQTFDIILVNKLPKEEDLKLYDIVVYEVDDKLVIHRIVGIEEPNAEHPDERHFLLQGDASQWPDRFPVRYEQMKGIYTGVRIPFVGSFVSFMQSPAGVLCILLLVFAVIIMPVIDNGLQKKKKARLIEIGFITEDGAIVEVAPAPKEDEVVATVDEESAVVSRFATLPKAERTFREKLERAGESAKYRYEEINGKLTSVKQVRVIFSKQSETYKKGKAAIARLTVKGKTVNAYLALNPEEYKDSKYIFTDASVVKAYQRYPMRVKLSSDRQVKWAKELIDEIVKKKGLEYRSVFEGIKFTAHTLTFRERMSRVKPEMRERLNAVTAYINSIDGVRAVESKRGITVKKGALPVVKLTVKGKTVNAYLALNPDKYKDSKYIFTDASTIKAYERYPMRITLTSNRKVKHLIELMKGIIG